MREIMGYQNYGFLKIASWVLVAANFFTLQAGWVHGQLGTIVYSVFIPSSYSATAKYPLLVHLHGAGERGKSHENINKQDLQNLSSDSSQLKYPCIIYAPQCDTTDKWVGIFSWKQVNYSMQNITPTQAWTNAMKGLDTVLAKYSIDTNRIYIAGGSMGGYGTWYTLCKYPKRFTAAVPIAGGGDTNAVAPLINVPLWAFHGTSDTIVPVAGSRSMIRAFTRFGGVPKFTEYSTTQINRNGYEHYGDHIYYLPFPLEPTLKEWIFSKNKTTTLTNKINGNNLASICSKKAKINFILNPYRSLKLMIRLENPDGEPATTFDIRGARIY